MVSRCIRLCASRFHLPVLLDIAGSALRGSCVFVCHVEIESIATTNGVDCWFSCNPEIVSAVILPWPEAVPGLITGSARWSKRREVHWTTKVELAGAARAATRPTRKYLILLEYGQKV